METKYSAYKLGRRSDSWNKGPPAVWNGLIFHGCKAYVYDYDKPYGERHDWNAEKFIPEIGKCVLIQGRGLRDSVTTSAIQDFYIHGDYENSKDKIVLKPENASLLDGIQFEDGDILLITLNSLYLLKIKPIPREE